MEGQVFASVTVYATPIGLAISNYGYIMAISAALSLAYLFVTVVWTSRKLLSDVLAFTAYASILVLFLVEVPIELEVAAETVRDSSYDCFFRTHAFIAGILMSFLIVVTVTKLVTPLFLSLLRRNETEHEM